MKITRQEYARRRRALMELMEPDSIAIVASSPERLRRGDTDYPCRHDSDLHYLSGFDERSAVRVLRSGPEHGEYVAVCREGAAEWEIWVAPRAGPEGACRHYGADDAFPSDDIHDILP